MRGTRAGRPTARAPPAARPNNTAPLGRRRLPGKLADFQQTDGPKPTDADAKFGTALQL
ncbi:hypothetical protein [Streptomyces mirabilis]|uniref:hypothetical protein n=1 Tax=Streptomyces mirabilis TaxID=68239 RepID=UPI0034328278